MPIPQIVITGEVGSGKSTLAQLVGKALREAGLQVCVHDPEEVFVHSAKQRNREDALRRKCAEEGVRIDVIQKTTSDRIAPTVVCSHCNKPAPRETAHRHEKAWVGLCCRDVRMQTQT